jgi:amino acid adenylation domain-containing protein
MRADDQTGFATSQEEYEFPVSPEQEGLLVLQHVHPASFQYNVAVAFAVYGPFNTGAFAGAFDALVDRHESLRTVFRTRRGEHVQVVTARARARAQLHRAGLAADAHATMLGEAARPFDIEHGPLLRCGIHSITDGSHRILLVAHHLICDGWSLQIMLHEVGVSYRAAVDGDLATNDALPIQYPDYAAWRRNRLNSGGYADAVAHWVQLLRDAPAILSIPTRFPRPAVQSTAGSNVRFVLSSAVWERLSRMARDCQTTPFVVLFAAFNVFLSRICGQDDLVVGVPISGRDRPDLQGMVGMLANTLALRTDLRGNPTFSELINRVREMLDTTRADQDAPFSAVVDGLAPRRELSHDPVVQVAFAYDDELRLDLADARSERVELELDAAKYDLQMEVGRAGSDLCAHFTYRTDLLDRATVQHWARSFQVLLDSLLSQPDRPVAALDMLHPDDRDQIVRGWNRTGTDVPDQLIGDLVAERAAEHPGKTALVCGDTVLTYRELLARADRLASQLQAAGVGPEVPVGLCLPRSAEMPIAALAVLRAGGAYLPLDPEHPPARLDFMLSDAGARLVLAGPGTARRVAASGIPTAVLEEGASGFAGGIEAVGRRPAARPGPANAAYILYTSGSTGVPKGVVVEHRALTNLAAAVRRRFLVTARDRVLQCVSFGFDIAVSDLFFTWAAGAELHIAGEHEQFGEPLLTRLRDSRISIIVLPPSMWMTLPRSAGVLPGLRVLAVGGEPCSPELIERWSAPSRRVLNVYGPSETTVYATTAEVLPGRPVVIGKPVANTRVYVLDHRLCPVPTGVTGEIYLAGLGLARGYASHPGMTAERFVASPFGPPGSRLYRTGDLASYDERGALTFRGRTDTQVKIRGFRVELGEIETVLAAHPDVATAAATVLGAGDARLLVAYVVGADGAPPGAGHLRAWLAERLPRYMLPEAIVAMDVLPLIRSGKLDRARLPQPPASRPELSRSYTAPVTAAEHRLAEVWARVLGLDRIGVHDNFFDLGGNSLRLLAVLTALREQGDGEVSLVDLFRYPSVSALAGRLDRSAVQPPGNEAAKRRGDDRRARLAARTAEPGRRLDRGTGAR